MGLHTGLSLKPKVYFAAESGGEIFELVLQKSKKLSGKWVKKVSILNNFFGFPRLLPPYNFFGAHVCSFSIFLFRQRSWIGIYTSEELEYACEIGYTILDTFEVFAYKEEAAIFQEYLKVLAYYKIRVNHTSLNHAQMHLPFFSLGFWSSAWKRA